MMGASSSAVCLLFKRFPKNSLRYGFLYINIILYVIFSNGLVEAAPYRSKNKARDGPQLVYDQKQTGDYNIQLHLKDFQIIALLGDDTLGDYDYNYDYADFTIKPSGASSTSTTPKSTTSTTRPPSTTPKIPSSTSEATFIPQKESTSSILVEASAPDVFDSNSNSKPIVTAIHPYPPVEPTNQPAGAEDAKIKDTKKSDGEDSLNEILNSSSTTSVTEISTDPSSTSSPTLLESMTPGKIKVQILEAPSPTVDIGSASVGIVPGEDVQPEISAGILEGEVASYRKCATGFTRDKRGRCRRVRRPAVTSQLPFGFSRIASNLATRLKLPIQSKSAEVPLSVPLEN